MSLTDDIYIRETDDELGVEVLQVADPAGRADLEPGWERYVSWPVYRRSDDVKRVMVNDIVALQAQVKTLRGALAWIWEMCMDEDSGPGAAQIYEYIRDTHFEQIRGL